MSTDLIPFNRPGLVGNELRYVADAITRGHTAGDGAYSKKCHAFLEEVLGVRRALLTTSCTHALEMAALLLDIQPGDEVIVPSFTFVSTVNAFALRGARPVFADIRPDTFNLDENQVEALVTPKTRAILPVHYAGVACEMDCIMQVASRHGLAVVEDNAHGLFAEYKGKKLGTFGGLSTQSFHETKNIICGEGGALLINDEKYVERAEIIREKGTNRSRFYRGQVDKYTWVDVGSSFLPSDVLAAFLYAQLEKYLQITETRRVIWEQYARALTPWAAQHGVQLPYCPPGCKQSYHMFYLVLPSLEVRTALIDFLRARGVMSVFHYQPLHLSEMGRKFGGKDGQCPVTELAGDRLVRLPFFNELSIRDQDRVVDGILAFDRW